MSSGLFFFLGDGVKGQWQSTEVLVWPEVTAERPSREAEQEGLAAACRPPERTPGIATEPLCDEADGSDAIAMQIFEI